MNQLIKPEGQPLPQKRAVQSLVHLLTSGPLIQVSKSDRTHLFRTCKIEDVIRIRRC
jgi:hypothetical protein